MSLIIVPFWPYWTETECRACGEIDWVIVYSWLCVDCYEAKIDQERWNAIVEWYAIRDTVIRAYRDRYGGHEGTETL